MLAFKTKRTNRSVIAEVLKMGNIDTKMNIITTIKEFLWPSARAQLVEPVVADPGDLDDYVLAVMASYAAYKSTDELNRVVGRDCPFFDASQGCD